MLAHARQNGKRLSRPRTAAQKTGPVRELFRAGVSKAEIARRLQIGRTSVRLHSGTKTMKKRRKDPVREDRIHNEAIVEAYGPEEQAMGWYYYQENKLRFPFHAKCVTANVVCPRRKGETVEVRRMAPEHACPHDKLVLVRWQSRNMAAPLSQLAAIDPDESTDESYRRLVLWVAQGCPL
jgi:hypothetical protein